MSDLKGYFVMKVKTHFSYYGSRVYPSQRSKGNETAVQGESIAPFPSWDLLWEKVRAQEGNFPLPFNRIVHIKASDLPQHVLEMLKINNEQADAFAVFSSGRSEAKGLGLYAHFPSIGGQSPFMSDMSTYLGKVTDGQLVLANDSMGGFSKEPPFTKPQIQAVYDLLQGILLCGKSVEHGYDGT